MLMDPIHLLDLCYVFVISLVCIDLGLAGGGVFLSDVLLPSLTLGLWILGIMPIVREESVTLYLLQFSTRLN